MKTRRVLTSAGHADSSPMARLHRFPSSGSFKFLQEARSELEHLMQKHAPDGKLDGDTIATERQVLERVYKWVRRADETCSYHADKISVQLEQEHQRAQRAESALSESRELVKSLEEHLADCKGRLLREEGEMKKLKDRNALLEGQLQQLEQEMRGFDKQQMMMRILHAERELEQEASRREEAERTLQLAKTQHIEDKSVGNKEAEDWQDRTRKILDQVSWQGQTYRLQLAEEQIRVRQAEELCDELSKEVSGCKKQFRELQQQFESSRSANAKLRLHQADLCFQKLASVERQHQAALLLDAFTQMKRTYLQHRRATKNARIITVLRVDRHRKKYSKSASAGAWQRASECDAAVQPWMECPPSAHALRVARGMGRHSGSKLARTLDVRTMWSCLQTWSNLCRGNRAAKLHRAWQTRVVEILFKLSSFHWLHQRFRYSFDGLMQLRGLREACPFVRVMFLSWKTLLTKRRNRNMAHRISARQARRLLAASWWALERFAFCSGVAKASAVAHHLLLRSKALQRWSVGMGLSDRPLQAWSCLATSLRKSVFKDGISCSRAWLICRKAAHEGASLRCSRANLSTSITPIYLHLVLKVWRQAALCTAMCILQVRYWRVIRMASHAAGIKVRDSANHYSHVTFYSWSGVVREQRRRRARQNWARRRHKLMTARCTLRRWVQGARVHEVVSARLKEFFRLAVHAHTYHAVRTTRVLRSIYVSWREGARASTLGLALQLATVSLSMRRFRQLRKRMRVCLYHWDFCRLRSKRGSMIGRRQARGVIRKCIHAWGGVTALEARNHARLLELIHRALKKKCFQAISDNNLRRNASAPAGAATISSNSSFATTVDDISLTMSNPSSACGSPLVSSMREPNSPGNGQRLRFLPMLGRVQSGQPGVADDADSQPRSPDLLLVGSVTSYPRSSSEISLIHDPDAAPQMRTLFTTWKKHTVVRFALRRKSRKKAKTIWRKCQLRYCSFWFVRCKTLCDGATAFHASVVMEKRRIDVLRHWRGVRRELQQVRENVESQQKEALSELVILILHVWSSSSRVRGAIMQVRAAKLARQHQRLLLRAVLGHLSNLLQRDKACSGRAAAHTTQRNRRLVTRHLACWAEMVACLRQVNKKLRYAFGGTLSCLELKRDAVRQWRCAARDRRRRDTFESRVQQRHVRRHMGPILSRWRLLMGMMKRKHAHTHKHTGFLKGYEVYTRAQDTHTHARAQAYTHARARLMCNARGHLHTTESVSIAGTSCQSYYLECLPHDKSTPTTKPQTPRAHRRAYLPSACCGCALYAQRALHSQSGSPSPAKPLDSSPAQGA